MNRGFTLLELLIVLTLLGISISGVQQLVDQHKKRQLNAVQEQVVTSISTLRMAAIQHRQTFSWCVSRLGCRNSLSNAYELPAELVSTDNVVTEIRSAPNGLLNRWGTIRLCVAPFGRHLVISRSGNVRTESVTCEG